MMQTLFTHLNSLVKQVISFIFPPRCVGCGQFGVFLCPTCLSRLPRSLSRREENIISVFDYSDPVVKRCIWLLKYRGVLDLAEIFGEALYDATLEELAEVLSFGQASGKILVIPVPLSAKRRRERGFNQAEEIARHFVALDSNNFILAPDLIAKIKDTPSQVSIKKRSVRLVNLKNAFLLKNKKKIRGKTVIIIDDVSTTGATINEIIKITHRAGARRVYGLVVAHV